MEALAFGGTETPSNRAGEQQSGVQAALNLPGRFLQRAKFPAIKRVVEAMSEGYVWGLSVT
jgi:hypothetical protein